MAPARLLLSAALLALLLGGAGALAWWGQGAAGASDEYAVEVVGPEGDLLSARVRVENATALLALQAAAREAGVAVETQEYPGMGTYVVAIGGHRAEGGAGWVYEVRRDGEWRFGDRSAARFPLEPGDQVRWRWSEREGAR